MRLVFLLARFSFNAELRRKTSGIPDFYRITHLPTQDTGVLPCQFTSFSFFWGYNMEYNVLRIKEVAEGNLGKSLISLLSAVICSSISLILFDLSPIFIINLSPILLNKPISVEVKGKGRNINKDITYYQYPTIKVWYGTF